MNQLGGISLTKLYELELILGAEYYPRKIGVLLPEGENGHRAKRSRYLCV